MIEKKRKNVFVVIALAIVGIYSLCFSNGVVFASGTGSDTGGVCTSNCGDPEWWGVYPYDTPGKGGISWKIFRRSYIKTM